MDAIITGKIFSTHGVSKSRAMKKFAKKHGLKIKKIKLKTFTLRASDIMGFPS